MTWEQNVVLCKLNDVSMNTLYEDGLYASMWGTNTMHGNRMFSK